MSVQIPTKMSQVPVPTIQETALQTILLALSLRLMTHAIRLGYEPGPDGPAENGTTDDAPTEATLRCSSRHFLCWAGSA